MGINWIDYTNDLLSPLNASTNTDKGRISLLISGAQAFIEKYCHRQFAFNEYTEQQTVGQDGSIILNQYPVNSISRLCFYNFGYLQIKNTTAQVATFGTTDTGLVLTSITNGIKTTTVLDYATYPTLTTLAGAIANVAGWSAPYSTGKGLLPSADLVARQFGNCVGVVNTLAQWEDYQGQFDYRQNGIIWGLLPLGLATGYSTPTAIPLNMFRDFKARVTYVAGYSEIPADLQMVLANLTMIAYNGSKEIQTETLGQWATTYFSPNLCTMADKKVLNYYKDRRV